MNGRRCWRDYHSALNGWLVAERGNENKPLPWGEVGGNLPVRALCFQSQSGIDIDCPYPLDSSRPLPGGEVRIPLVTRLRRLRLVTHCVSGSAGRIESEPREQDTPRQSLGTRTFRHSTGGRA